jgi:hypothetical protein
MRYLLMLVAASCWAQTDLPGPVNALPDSGAPSSIAAWNTNQTFRAGFTVDGSLAATLIWKLPTADGSSGQALVTNGSKVLSFATVSNPPFVDTTNIIKGSGDPTKLLKFEVDGLTTATTRTVTLQDADYIMAGIDIAQTFTVDQTFQNIFFAATGKVVGTGPIPALSMRSTEFAIVQAGGTGASWNISSALFVPAGGPRYQLQADNGVNVMTCLRDVGSTTSCDFPRPLFLTNLGGSTTRCLQVNGSNQVGAATNPCPSVATTTSTLAGDGAGNAVAVSGTGTNCVHVDGTSAVCSGGGTVTSISTTSPISGGTITTTGTISCPTCAVTNADNHFSTDQTFQNIFFSATGKLIGTGSIPALSVRTQEVAIVQSGGSAASWLESSATFIPAGGPRYQLQADNGVNVFTCLRDSGSTTSCDFPRPLFLSNLGGSTTRCLNVNASNQVGAAASDCVVTTRTISTSSPLGGGGDLSADRTLTCTTCVTTNGTQTYSGTLTVSGGIDFHSSGNIYIRAFSGGDASCGGVNDGWIGIRTDNGGSGHAEIQVCVGGATKTFPASN